MRWLSVLIAFASQLGAQRAVANGDVHVRSGQSKTSRILDTLFQGETVTLLDGDTQLLFLAVFVFTPSDEIALVRLAGQQY